MLFPHLSTSLIGLASLATAQTTTLRPSSIPTPLANTTFPLSNSTSIRTTLATITLRPTSTLSATAPKPTVSALGGIEAPAITVGTDSDRPFAANGNTFDSMEEAVNRACAIQNNACADAVNSGELKGVEVSDCKDQEDVCVAAGGV